MRKLIIAISCCIILLLLGFAGYRGYRIWKERHLVALARTFAERGDTRNEYLSLQQVLAVNPRNVEACRRMAMMTASPETIIWRQRVVDLAPESLADHLALVQAALQAGDLALATNKLAEISDAGKNTAAYHNLAGTIAKNLNHLAEAKNHFAEAVRLEPDNPAPQINLYVLTLLSSNPQEADKARADLKRFSSTTTNATIRIFVVRELLLDAQRSKDASSSLALAAELNRQTNATFGDKLAYLDVLQQQKQPALATTLAALQHEAATNSIKLAGMANWMMKRTTTAITLKWLQTLPASAQTNQPGTLLIAECLGTEKNWPALENILKGQDWNELDFTRHAMLSRALREQKMTAASTAEWELALRVANEPKPGQKAAVISLFQLAASWGWNNEAEQILWTIVNRYPEEKWAGPLLRQALMLGGRTQPLMQYLSLQANRTPHDLEVLNDLAMTAMLIGAQEILPYDLAQKVYEKSPTNAAFASTYAFALYQQKKYSQASEVLQKLGPDTLKAPSIAGYYGLVLKALGDNEKSKIYLSLALKERVMPEERKLFEQAMQ